MSWEGFEQLICTNGHYSKAGDGSAFYEVPKKCSCGAPWRERNVVDCTNGCSGDPCQCRMKVVEEVVPPVMEICNLGCSHVKVEGKYRLGKTHAGG